MNNDNIINSLPEEKNRRIKSLDYLKKHRKILEDGGILSIFFTGVGGQGIIMTCKVLATAAILEGFDVKVSEVHGMAQRGGSVVGSVRLGKKVYSPTIEKADIILSLEKLESLRYAHNLAEGGLLIVNDYEIYPISVFSKEYEYPDSTVETLNGSGYRNIFLDAAGIAGKLGEAKAANIVLLGNLSQLLPLSEESWLESIKQNIPSRALEINIEAFREGRKIT